MSNDLAFWLRRVIQLLAPVAEPPEAESPLPEQLTVAQKVPPTADELAVEEMWLQRAMAKYDPDRAPHAPGDATPAQRTAAAAAKWGELNAKPPRVEQRLNENLIHAVRQIAQLSVQRFGRSPLGLRMLRHGESGHPAMWYIAEKVEAYDYARYGNGQSGWVECETDEWETAEVARIDLWSPIRDRSRSVYPKNEECTTAVVQTLREVLVMVEQQPKLAAETVQVMPTAATDRVESANASTATKKNLPKKPLTKTERIDRHLDEHPEDVYVSCHIVKDRIGNVSHEMVNRGQKRRKQAEEKKQPVITWREVLQTVKESDEYGNDLRQAATELLGRSDDELVRICVGAYSTPQHLLEGKRAKGRPRTA